jgi:hypothetical protein
MRFLLILGVIVGTLALFNPGEDDFRVFVRERAAEMATDRARAAGGDLFGSVVGSVGGALAEAFASRAVERDSYLVASVYTLDLDGPEHDREEWRFLGVAGQFIPLKKPASLGG